MKVSLISTCELQIDLFIKEDASTAKPRAHPNSPSYFFENSTHLWKLFQGKTFPKKCCIMLYIGFSDCFIATPEFQIFSAKSVMIVKVVRYLAKSLLMVNFCRFLPKTEVAVDRCSTKKLFRRVLKNSQENAYEGISV